MRYKNRGVFWIILFLSIQFLHAQTCPPQPLCSGESYTLTAAAGLSDYIWYKDGVVISGANSQVYIANAIGSYSWAGTSALLCRDTSCCATPIVAGTCGSCSLTDGGLTGIMCNDGGTPSDLTDDYISFSLNPQGTLLGSTYTVSAGGLTISPSTGTYGVATEFTLPAGTAGGGDIQLTITDISGGTCTMMVLLTDPGACSPCSVASVDSICPGESYTLTAASGLMDYQWFMDGMPVSGATSVSYIATAAGSYTWTADSTGGTCHVSCCAVEIVSAVNCSTCSLTDGGLTGIMCNDGGTPSDLTDDYISFSLNPQGTLLGSTYTVSAGGLTISPSTGTYGVATEFTLPAGTAGGGDIQLTITDVSGGTCTMMVLLTDPGACSPCNPNAVPYVICPGESYTLTAASGLMDYKWYANGQELIGEVGTALVVDTTGSYTWTATNSGGCIDSSCCPILFEMPISPSVQLSNDTSICAGNTASLVAIVDSTSNQNCTLVWEYFDGSTWTAISGATGTNYTTPSLVATTLYRVSYNCSSNSCGAVQNTVEVTVVPIPTVADVQLTCPSGGGATPTFYDFALSGTWEVVSQPSTANAAVSSAGLVTNMTEDGDYTFKVTVNDCSAEVLINKPFCCPAPVCLPVQILRQ